jgi:hypothetical protein
MNRTETGQWTGCGTTWAHKLLPAIPSPAARYRTTDLRAFFAVALRTDPTAQESQ